MSVVIREATPDEYPAVGALTVASFDEFAGYFGDGWAEYRAELLDVAERAAHGVVLVATEHGALLGTATYYRPPGEAGRGDWWWWPLDVAYLRAVAVHPDHRGRGLGRRLTQAVIDRAAAEGAAGVALNTTPGQVAAVALYEQLGFRRIPSDVLWVTRDFLSYILPLNSPLADEPSSD